MTKFRTGILLGAEVDEVYDDAKRVGYALPAVNVVSTSTVNSVMEAAANVQSPVIIQLSFGGGQFYAGKSLRNDQLQASAVGCLSAAKHVADLAEHYGVSVIMHTDHCSLGNIHWIDQMLDVQERHVEQFGKPLFSSHMLDLSEETLEENVAISKRYFERMSALQIGLEIELGITGGEEDGVDNLEVDASKLYTQPEHVFYAYELLNEIGPAFSIAAAFGNVHGVYKPGNVKLSPKILRDSQAYVAEKIGGSDSLPVNFVFHGGSGSALEDIREAIGYGVIKMNIDTDMQWAFNSGLRDYFADNKDYLATQIGNPEGDDQPNKKYYDPRKTLRQAETYFVKRLEQSFADLNCINRNT